MIFSKLEKLGLREKAFLIIAVLMLLAVLADRLVIQSVVDRLAELKAATEIEQKSLAYSQTVIECEQDVEDIFQAVSVTLGQATTPANDIEVMVGEIDDLARQSGLLLVSKKPREPCTSLHCNEYILDIDGFEGNMQSLLRFLNTIQRSPAPGLLRVVHLNVSTGREENSIKGAMTVTRVMTREEN